MRITRRTDTELELRESPALVWLIVGVFGIGGTWVLVHEGELVIAAGFAVLVAALALVFAISTHCRFDRAGGELSCASVHPAGPWRTWHIRCNWLRTSRFGKAGGSYAGRQAPSHGIAIATFHVFSLVATRMAVAAAVLRKSTFLE